jgi:molybdenum cofactor guanylyltransferase
VTCAQTIAGEEDSSLKIIFEKLSVYDSPMGNLPASDVTASILAGGKSTRMGTDKAFVEFEGRTLLARALDLGRSVSADVRIIGSTQKFASFASVVEDVFRGCGPLAGIHAALLASPTDLNLILAVDTPFISHAFLEYLVEQSKQASALAVVPHCDDHCQPLCAIYRRGFAVAAENAWRAGQNKIDPLFGVVPTRTIQQDELKNAGFGLGMFRNLNTPQELKSRRESIDAV